MREQVNCYEINAPRKNCSCVPENTFQTHFEEYPIQSWGMFNTNKEYKNSFWVMHEMVTKACPISYKREVYKGQNWKLQGFSEAVNSSYVFMALQFSTMDIEYRDEVFIQDAHAFIGIVGGYLGLFIGFSFTGCFGQLIHFFIKDK